jgi:rubrerythrin
MSRELNALDVLQIAVEMEQNAVKFYTRAAGIFADSSLNKLFLDLAQWEKRHADVFAEMRDRVSEHTWESGQLQVDRANLERLHVPPAVFEEDSDPAQELTGCESRGDMLRLALEKERYTIGYYTALTEFALGQENLKVITELVREEKRHIRILSEALEQCSD